MAISTTYKDLKDKYNSHLWSSFTKFKEFYLKWWSEKSENTNYYTDENGIEIKISPINHFPELQEYEVWISGYQATGESGQAFLYGKAKARNFAQACHIVMCTEYLKSVDTENSPDNKQYVTPGRWDYDNKKLTYWGCPLYWSEELARKSFG